MDMILAIIQLLVAIVEAIIVIGAFGFVGTLLVLIIFAWGLQA